MNFDWQPLFLSLRVASAALCLAFFAGTLAAYVVTRRRFWARDFIDALFLLPLVLPPVVTGYALLILLGRRGAVGIWLQNSFGVQWLFTPYAAILASFIVAFPLMYGSAKAAFLTIDSQCIDAARALGAGSNRVFWTVILPLSWTGLVAGAVLSFARALGEFGATVMVAGNIEGKTVTVPTAIYNAVESGDGRSAAFYVSIIATVNLLFIVILNLWMRRSHLRNI